MQVLNFLWKKTWFKLNIVHIYYNKTLTNKKGKIMETKKNFSTSILVWGYLIIVALFYSIILIAAHIASS